MEFNEHGNCKKPMQFFIMQQQWWGDSPMIERLSKINQSAKNITSKLKLIKRTIL